MPIECGQLRWIKPYPVDNCPQCDMDFTPFMRGTVQRPKRTLFSWPPFRNRPYCALICSLCKEVIGYEAPPVPAYRDTHLGRSTLVGLYRYELKETRGVWERYDYEKEVRENS